MLQSTFALIVALAVLATAAPAAALQCSWYRSRTWDTSKLTTLATRHYGAKAVPKASDVCCNFCASHSTPGKQRCTHWNIYAEYDSAFNFVGFNCTLYHAPVSWIKNTTGDAKADDYAGIMPGADRSCLGRDIPSQFGSQCAKGYFLCSTLKQRNQGLPPNYISCPAGKAFDRKSSKCQPAQSIGC